jgi:hypothetical protein
MTVGNFEGFESGGFEPSRAITGSPTIQSGVVQTGTFALQTDAGESSSWYVKYDEEEAPGSPYIVKIAVQFSSISPSVKTRFLLALQGGPAWSLWLKADGDLEVQDANGGIISTVTSPFTAGEFHFVEVFFENLDSGDIEIFIDDLSVFSSSGEDLNSTGSLVAYSFGNTAASNITIYVDDYYSLFSVSSAADRLGKNTNVLGAYQNTVEDATDQGTTLDVGTWAFAGEVPVSEVNTAEYTGGVASGHTITDDADSNLRPGPNGDPAVTGTIIAAKWEWWAKRGGGGGTEHYLVYGHNGDTASTADIGLTNAYVYYSELLEVSDSKVPTVSESFALGIAKNGGARDFILSDQWATLLHRPPGVSVPKISINHPMRNPLLRL